MCVCVCVFSCECLRVFVCFDKSDVSVSPLRHLSSHILRLLSKVNVIVVVIFAHSLPTRLSRPIVGDDEDPASLDPASGAHPAAVCVGSVKKRLHGHGDALGH